MLKEVFIKNKNFYFSILLYFFGLFFTFNYWWNKIDLSFLNVAVSFYSYSLSSLLLANFVTQKFIAPSDSNFSSFIIDEKKLDQIIEKIGKEKYQNVKRKNGFLFAGIATIYLVINYTFMNSYEKYQLKNYGEVKEVKIENKSKNIKGLDFTTIEYENIEKELFLNSYKIGEKQKIIYSKKNPKIAEWLEEYQKKFR